MKEGNLEVIELFLIAGMEVDIRNDEETQDTALMWACKYKYFNMVILLIESGADVHAYNAIFQTPMMFAVFGGSLNIVKYLRSHRASFGIPRVAGIGGHMTHPRSSLDWAAYEGHLDIIKYITEEVGDRGVPYDCTSINRKGLACENAASWAAFRGHLPIVRFFIIEKETPPDPYNGRGPTILMFAAAAGQGHVVSFLLDHGASIHSRSSRFEPVETPVGTDYIEVFEHSAVTLAITSGILT